jgi:HAD superfamily hydrolase (TIGR01509 family)
MIKAVIFDLGGVYFTDGFRSAIIKFHRQFGIPVKKLRLELTQGIGKEYAIGKLSRKKFWEEFTKKFSIKQSHDKLDDMWNGSYCINSELRGIVKLVGKKCTTGIISSTSKHRLTYLNEKYSFYRDFKYRQFSYATHYTKTDQRTYSLLVKKLKLKPNEILYIDDETEHLRVARKAGLRTIQFRGNLKLIRDLEKLKLLE